MKKTIVLLAVFLNCAFRSDGQEVIRFGFIAPLSGETAAAGLDERNAVEMALSEINASDFLRGRRLEVIFEDGKCSGKDAAVAVQKLVAIDRVKVILGGCCSGETLGAAPITEKAGVILFSAFSSNPAITTAGDFVFRTAPSDDEGGKAAARLAAASSGSKKVGVISENTDFSLGFRKAFVEALPGHGLELVGDENYNPSDSDLRSVLLRLKARAPEILLLNPQNGRKGGLLVKQLAEMGWRPVLIGNFVFSSSEAAVAAGGIEKLEGIRFADAPEVDSTAGREFLKKFESRYPSPQTPFEVVLRYESVFILAHAIKTAGYDAVKIRDYLYSMPPYAGRVGTFHFDRNGDVVGIPYASKVIRNGKIEVLD